MSEISLFSYLVYFLVAGVFLSLASYMDTLVMRENGVTSNSQPRSACDHCGRQLRWFELLPLVSFILQRGKCRSCQSPIDPRIFFSELMGLVTGIIFATRTLQILVAETTPGIKMLVISIEAAVFIVLLYLAIYDLFTYSMPTWTLTVLGFIAVGINVLWLVMLQYSAWDPVAFATYGSVANLVVGIVSGLSFGLIILLTKEKGLGMGDLYLAVFLGLLLGWPAIISALYVMLGSAITVGLIYCYRLKRFRGVILPLVPFIALGFMCAITFGHQIFGILFPFI